MKNLLIAGLLALAVLSGCEWLDKSSEDEPEPDLVDKLVLHNQEIQKMIVDTIASVDSITMVTFIQPNGTYYNTRKPFQIKVDDIVVQLCEEIGAEEYISKLDLNPVEDGLWIYHVLYSDTVSEDHLADVYTNIDLAYAYIDSVHSMYCYHTIENDDLQYCIAQELGDDIYYPEDYQEGDIKRVLQIYLNEDLYSVADIDIEYDFIYTPRQ